MIHHYEVVRLTFVIETTVIHGVDNTIDNGIIDTMYVQLFRSHM